MSVFIGREKKCKGCKNFFSPKKKNHLYCLKKCYLAHYRGEINKEDQLPSFSCPQCKKTTKLTFSPLKKPLLWMKYKCKCGYTNSDNDYKEIAKIKKELKNS